MLANTENFARMGVLALLQEDREKWRQSLVASHAALSVVLFVFVLCAWTTDNTCYMTPCAVGTGLETVWKVSEWTVFTSLVAGAWSITIASAGLMLFYKYLDDPRCEGAHMAVGLFLGCSFSSVLVMLDQFGVWSAEWDLMGALSTVNHRNEIFYNNGNHLHLSNGLLPQFKANAVLAFLAVMIQAAIIGQIAIGQGALSEIFKLRTGSDQAESPLLGAKMMGQTASV